jgi:hypothetical protein
MNDYPKMLYRCAKPGEGEDVCEGHHVHMLIVNDEDSELAALDDGWRNHPAPPVKPKKAEAAK